MTVSSSGGQARSLAEWVLPGLVAGMMFAMFAMVVGVFASALWAPPQGIAQAIGIGPNGHDFHVVPFILGLMGHMMNSIVIGAIFVALVHAARPSATMTAMAGVAYGLAVYAVIYWVLLRHVFTLWAAPGVQSFLSSNPEWAWIVGHLVFGMVLGGLLAYGPGRLATGQPTGRLPAG
jgi:hypothetical protein